jgi:tetratricopeptide (TPR) repeat protein
MATTVDPRPTDERARLALAVAQSPRDPALRRSLGRALAKAGEPRAALEQYRAVLALLPNDPDAAADAGLMARRCGIEEEILPLVRDAAAANPDHPRLWQVLGLMHRALDELGPAIEALTRAARLAPHDPLIAHGVARAELEAGGKAVALFKRAMSLAPADESVILGLAAALIAEGRWPEAISELETRLGAQPGWVPGHATLARLRWMMGDRDGFTASFERALAHEPRHLLLWRELIVTLMHADLYDQALDAIARGRAAAGPASMFDVNEAACRAEKGEVEAADRLFAAIGPLDDDPPAGVRHIRHLLRSGRPDQAAAMAETWLGRPGAVFFWPYLAAAWRLIGNPRWEWLEGDPRLVGIYDLSAALPSLDDLAERLRSLHFAVGQPLEQSVRGGTQTDGNLFSHVEPEIRALRQAVVDAVRTHVAQLPPHDPRHPQLGCPRSPIRFSGSWSVRLTGGGRHANHIHPAGWFSSALYIALPAPGERGPEPAGWLTLGEPQAELQLPLEPFRLVEPAAGRLVLFPSTIWHGTRPFDAGERLTVAFDVAMPV